MNAIVYEAAVLSNVYPKYILVDSLPVPRVHVDKFNHHKVILSIISHHGLSSKWVNMILLQQVELVGSVENYINCG